MVEGLAAVAPGIDAKAFAQLTAHLVLAGEANLDDLATRFNVDIDEVRAAVALIAGGLGTLGVVVIDDGTQVHVSGRRTELVGTDLYAAWDAAVREGAQSPASAQQLPDIFARGRQRAASSAGARHLVSPVLIQREPETDQLLTAAEHRPALVLVEGEAGVGKTRLVADLLARPELIGVQRLVGRAHPLRQPFPYGPILEALRGITDLRRVRGLSALVGVLRHLLPEMRDDLPPEPDLGGSSGTDRHLVFRAIRELLLKLGPTVLALEDLHWADEGTLELIRFLTADFPPDVSMLVTYRAADLRPDSALQRLAARPQHGLTTSIIHLEPLSIDGVRELLGAILGTDSVADAVAAYVHARTAGLPLAVEEVARVLQEHPELVRRSDSLARRALEGLEIPATIRDSVIERSAQLPRDARRIVDAAAVLSAPASLELLGAVAQLTPAQSFDALRSAADSGLLLELHPNQYGLRHPLAVAAVYESIPLAERSGLHLRAARVLEEFAPKPAALLARHYQAAGRTREWLVHAEAAADAAAERGNAADAVRLLIDALESHPGAETSARLGLKLGRAALNSHAFRDEATTMLRGLLALRPVTRLAKGRIRALLGLLLMDGGDASAAYEQQAQAVSELRGDPSNSAMVMANLAMPWVVEGNRSDHRRWLASAVETAAQTDDPRVTLTVQGIRALVPLYFGEPEGWRMVSQLPTERLGDAENRQLLWLVSHLVGACFYLGHYERARAYLDEARVRAGAMGWDRYQPLRETAARMLEWATGEWSGLDERVAMHVERMAVDYPPGAVLGKITGALLALARADLDNAERDLQACVAAARASGLIPALSLAAGGLARLHLARGRASNAGTEAMAAIDVFAAKGIWAWAGDVAHLAVESLVANAQLADARRLTDRFARGLRTLDAPLAHASLTECRGHVARGSGDHRAAADLFVQAAGQYAALPRRYEAALAAAHAGNALLEGGADHGAEPLLAALAELDQLGAELDVRRIRKALRDRAIHFPSTRRGKPKTYGGGLSPREIEIAELAARGERAADIARVLFLSPRTVNNHLTAIMRKLGVKTRAQLIVRWAAQRPSEARENPRGGRRRPN